MQEVGDSMFPVAFEDHSAVVPVVLDIPDHICGKPGAVHALSGQWDGSDAARRSVDHHEHR